jgi:HlyD family secretion protein
MEEMGTQTTEVAVAPAPAVQKKKRKNKKVVKRIITIAIVLLVVGGIIFGITRLFKEEETENTILSDFVTRGSIQSPVTGSGVTKAKDSATITLSSGGTVLDVYVKDGDMVTEGDPLYTIDSTEAMEAVDSAQKTVTNYEKQLKAIVESYYDLTVKAPFAGTLIKVEDIDVGDDVATGTKIATLVDDRTMKLELYFSYSYENEITVGQSAAVSIPATMNQVTGTVEEVNYVRKVTAEGSMLFQVVISIDNPGALTADMGASATLTSSGGEMIYPYEGAKLTYNRSSDIVTKAGGEALSVNLINYSQVSSGETLLVMDGEDNDEQVATLENQLKTANDALEKAQENLKNFNAVAPMSGTVLSCTLVPGETVENGRVAVTIADTTVMTVEAQIDEMNVVYVKPGMYCDITQWGRNGQEMFGGIIESVSLEGKFENGVSFFPAIIKVENPDGRLMSGMYVDYNLIAAQSDNCLMVPVQAVKYTEMGTCLFIKADAPPENALDAVTLGLDVPEGFYAVPVSVGLSDNTFAEIIEGVEEGTEVFTQFMTNNGSSDMMGGSVMIG